MNDYLTKPLHIAQLDAALTRASRRRVPVEKLNIVLDPICIAGLKELREPGQPDPLVELFDLFNRESDACVQKMDAGLAAQDANGAARAAHSLKGSASNLGEHRLAGACAAFEQSAKSSGWTQAEAQLREIRTQLEKVRESLKAEFQVPEPDSKT